MVKRLNCSSTSEPDQRLGDEKRCGLRDADLSGRDRARARALDQGVEIAVDDVVPGAAGAAHGEGADEEQREVPQARQRVMRRDGRESRPTTSTACSSSQEPIGRSRRARRK